MVKEEICLKNVGQTMKRDKKLLEKKRERERKKEREKNRD